MSETKYYLEYKVVDGKLIVTDSARRVIIGGLMHYIDKEIDNDFGRDRDLIFNKIKYFDYTFDETFE